MYRRNHGKVDILFPYSQKTSSHHFISHRSCGQIWDFDSQGLANVTWSFAVLGFKCQGPRVKSGGSSPSSPPCGFEPNDWGPKLSDAILKAAKAKMEAEDFGAQESKTLQGNDHSEQHTRPSHLATLFLGGGEKKHHKKRGDMLVPGRVFFPQSMCK